VKKRATQKRERISEAVRGMLRAERERAGLSMLAVAERAGLSQQMVSYVERGMRNPSLDTLLRLTAALELRLSVILRRAEAKAAAADAGGATVNG
jgi:transcriptional regulator with XRE-family HTH domain